MVEPISSQLQALFVFSSFYMVPIIYSFLRFIHYLQCIVSQIYYELCGVTLVFFLWIPLLTKMS